MVENLRRCSRRRGTSTAANAIRNDVMGRLLQQKELPAGLGTRLLAMQANPDADPVWRDYCIQFMAPLYDRLATKRAENTTGLEKDFFETSVSFSEAGGENNVSNELAAVRNAMFQALDQREGTFATTPLFLSV